MEKRVRFRSLTLPWLLLVPQLAIITVFFFWPAGQALVQSVQLQDAFGTSTEFVGLDNFRRLFADELYIESFRVTAVFSVLVAVCGIRAAAVAWALRTVSWNSSQPAAYSSDPPNPSPAPTVAPSRPS